MEFNFKEGIIGKSEKTVTIKDTAKMFGSGSIEVFATPLMIGLMENSALNCVDDLLPDGYSTVGINVTVDHIAATPVGDIVRSEATLIKIDGKKLTFNVEAFDTKQMIGKGTHTRYIVDVDKFNDKVKR